MTNFFFETPDADGDVQYGNGDTGEKGLRKFGPGEENRKRHGVRAGLFMCDGGIPIPFMTFPWHTLDHRTPRPAADDDDRHWSCGMSGARLSANEAAAV